MFLFKIISNILMSYSEVDGITDLSNVSEREDFIDKISEMLEGSVIRGYKNSDNKIVFDINRKQNDIYYDSEIQIRQIDNFYFRRFETGMMRKGLHNINRLHLGENMVEHISSINYWKHAMSGQDGIQIVCYSGKMLRFVGKSLEFEIEDGNEVYNEYPTPEKIETPLTKLLYYSDPMIKKSKALVKKIRAIKINYDVRDNEFEKTLTQIKEERMGMITDEFKEFVEIEENDDLTEEQQRVADEILDRIKRENEDYKNKNPKEYFDIYEF